MILEKKKENCTILSPKGKSILSPQKQRQGPWFKVSFKGLSTEIDILICLPIQELTEADDA